MKPVLVKKYDEVITLCRMVETADSDEQFSYACRQLVKVISELEALNGLV